MNRTTRPLLGSALLAVGLVVAAASPATAATQNTPAEGEDVLGYNGGGITIDAGPEYAGYDVLVQAQLPKPISPAGSGGNWVIRTASLDAEGVGRAVNFAGPVNLYFYSPSETKPELELPEPEASASIYRGGEIEYDVDPEAGTAVVDGAVPTVVAPALSSFQPYIVPFTDAAVDPSSYLVGEAFDLTFSNLEWATAGDLDGVSTSTIIYSEPTTIGTAAIAGGSVTTTIGAEYTTDPHTVALMDGYGRILASATLDGGAAATPGTTPTAAPTTPVAAAPVAHTGAKPGTRSGAHLAETGVETGAGALLAGLLLAAGTGGLVVARRRSARA
ncbi:LPXTG cell wall anchor domain-containing protein [Rathayibacter sp. SD072]|uniref:LPXTG cell wall anchor domain-containing protein n=1 Tax=Rathayibacter sp. SD072 TaxID=2781731 RepID=UPI001A96914D|nr:LPXTG cell wall anchor domain-containing protein [Rathayibacter sp. SD072]MBO0985635.1 LPXTG cell wall anchor domain-containing protein [Rathayibacter sp. SD072]